MKKIFKKSLAIMVSAAICLTALIGCLSVSAATRGEGTFTVGSDSGKPGASVTVPIELKYTSGGEGMGIAASLFDVSYNTNALTITDIAAGEDATYTPGLDGVPGGEDVPPQDIYTVEYRSTDGAVRILAMPADNETVLTSMTVNLTFTINEGAAVQDYAITITKQQTCDYGHATPDELGNFTYADDEEFIKMSITEGAVTVVEDVTGPIYDASVKIVGKNGLFESDYSLIYYVPATLPEGWYISVTQANYNGNVRVEDVLATLTIEDVTSTVNVQGTELYLVALKGIAAKEVANQIIATLHKVVDGIDYYGDAVDYNLVTYAETRISNTQNDAEIDAMAAFLNYAAAAQNRFAYNTENLANASLTDEQKEIAPISEITDASRNDNYATIENPVASINGFMPSYEDKMTLATIFTADEETINSGAKIKYEYTSGSVAKTEYVDLTEGVPYMSKYYLVDFTGLAIKDVRTPVLITIVDSEGNAISNTRQYSFEVYAASRSEGQADYIPARAMIAFGDLFKVFKES